MKSKLQLTNLTVGIVMLILFAVTGQLMRHYYHNADLPDVERLYRRSRHLFLLMAGLTHSGIGIYITAYQHQVANKLQWIATALMFLGSCVLVSAFFYEIPGRIVATPISRLGLYLLLAGAVFHFIGMLVERYRSKSGQS